jgi:hypothetical protein
MFFQIQLVENEQNYSSLATYWKQFEQKHEFGLILLKDTN